MPAPWHRLLTDEPHKETAMDWDTFMTVDRMLHETHESGGGTFDVRFEGETMRADTLHLTGGYVVGVAVGTFATADVTDSRAVLDGIRDLVRHFPGSLVGLWIDGGRVEIDPVVVVPTRTLAEGIAKLTAQRAYFDAYRGEVVHL